MSDRHHDHRPRNFGSDHTFRAFIAVDISTDAKHELSRLAGQIRDQCKGSFPSSDMYHMTIAFLGDITDVQSDAMCRVLEGLAGKYDPFELRLCRLGYFAQPESATVFCSTERDNTLLSLAQDVYRAAWEVRIPFDDKPFRAHITLGRRVDLSTIRLNSIEVEHVPFVVEGLTLYKSTLHPSGPTYEVVSKIAF